MVPEAERLEMLAYQRPVDLDLPQGRRRPVLGADQGRRARRARAHRGPLLQREDPAGGCCDRRADRGRQAPGVGHDVRAHPPDVHEPGRAARPQARRGPARADRRDPAARDEQVVVAYVPVLHEGYRRFLQRPPGTGGCYLIGPELLRRLPAAGQGHPRAGRRRGAPRRSPAWGIAASVEVLDAAGAAALAAEQPSLMLPAEDVSYQVVERFLPRAAVLYDTVFLRWDKTRTVAAARPAAAGRIVAEDAALAELGRAAEEAASAASTGGARSAPRCASPTARGRGAPTSTPHRWPRTRRATRGRTSSRASHLELRPRRTPRRRSSRRPPATGARRPAAELYVTDFPCPPCAKLIAGAGVARLLLPHAGTRCSTGSDVLEAAGVEVVAVAATPAPAPA